MQALPSTIEKHLECLQREINREEGTGLSFQEASKAKIQLWMEGFVGL